jgi:hypothetical protein
MNTIRNIRSKITSAAAALAVSAIFITAAAGPVSIPTDGPVSARNVA